MSTVLVIDCIQRTHICPPDLGPAFSKAVLYVLPLGTFVVPQAPDQIVQRLLEPTHVSLGFWPFWRCFTCWLRSEGLWNSTDVAGHDAGEQCCGGGKNDEFIRPAAQPLTSKIPTPLRIPDISYRSLTSQVDATSATSAAPRNPPGLARVLHYSIRSSGQRA